MPPSEPAAVAGSPADSETATTASSSAQGGADSPERGELLDRLLKAGREIGELAFLRRVVAHVEAVREDYAARAAAQLDAAEVAEELARARRPALIRQLRFYFCDANLRHDTFLRGLIDSDQSGCVPISKLLSFNRLKQMGCCEASEVAAAVEEAPSAAGLELSAARDGVRRAGGCPLPPALSADSPSERDECTIRIEQFPRGDTSVTAEAVTELCSVFGAVANVWLIRAKGSLQAPLEQVSEFLGIVEVEFQSKEAATAAVAAESPPAWCGAPLRLRSLADFRSERGGKRPAPSAPGEEDAAGTKRARIEEEARATAPRFDRGLVLRLDGVPEGITWREIKDAFKVFGDIVYVDHSPEVEGSGHQAWVRFRDADGVSAAMESVRRNGGRMPLESSASSEESGEVSAPQTVDAADTSVVQPSAAPAEAKKETEESAEGAEVVSQTDPYGGGEEAASERKTDPYGGVEEAAPPAPEPSPAEPAPAASSPAEPAPAESASVEPAPAESALAAPVAAAGAEVDDQDADADAEDLFVVDTEGSAMEAAPTSAAEAAAAGEAAEPIEAAAPDAKRRSVAVALLAGDEEETYIQRMALLLAEKRAAKSGGKGGKKSKDGGKSKGGVKGGKGKKDGKDGKKGGKKGGKRGKHIEYSDDSS